MLINGLTREIYHIKSKVQSSIYIIPAPYKHGFRVTFASLSASKPGMTNGLRSFLPGIQIMFLFGSKFVK